MEKQNADDSRQIPVHEHSSTSVSDKVSAQREATLQKKRKHMTDPGEEKNLSDCDGTSDSNSSLPADQLADKWLRPFELGWRRELVYRSIVNTDCVSKSPPADVYYFSPEGTKLRSMPQVIDYLEKQPVNDLTNSCFTFCKRPIFHEPDEVIRHASAGRTRQSVAKPSLHSTKDSDDSKSTLSPTGESDSNCDETPLQASKKLKPLRIVLSPTKTYSVDNSERTTSNSSGNKVPDWLPDDETLAVLEHPSNGDGHLLGSAFAEPRESVSGATCQVSLHPISNREASNVGFQKISNEQMSDGDNFNHNRMDSKNFEAQKSTLSILSKEDNSVSNCPNPVSSVMEIELENPLSHVTADHLLKTNHQVNKVSAGSNKPEVPLQNSELTRGAVEAPKFKQTDNDVDIMDIDAPLEDAINLKLTASGIHSRLAIASTAATLCSAPINCIQHFTSSPIAEQNQNWIGAQILTLPRDVANSLNLSRPITVRFNNRSIIVPSSCVALTAEGAKVLLPPHTLSSPSVAKQSEPMDFSIHFGADKLSVNTDYCKDASDEPSRTDIFVAEDVACSLQREPLDVSVDLSRKSRESTDSSVDLSQKSRESKDSSVDLLYGKHDQSEGCLDLTKDVKETQPEMLGVGIEVLDTNLDCMLHIFGYLAVVDLLEVSEVCERWREIARHTSLWKSVGFREVRVNSWPQAAAMFARCNTRSLDLSGVAHGQTGESRGWDEGWASFASVLDQLVSVTRLTFHHVMPSVLYAVIEKMPQLESLCATSIMESIPNPEVEEGCVQLDVGKFARLTNLRTLRLRSEESPLYLPNFAENTDILNLGDLNHLQDLQLATIAVYGRSFSFLSRLVQLECVDLGDCVAWDNETFGFLGELVNLRSLRLRCGGKSNDDGLALALPNLKKLHTLELTKFHISTELACALAELKHLQTLIVQPCVNDEWHNNSRMFVAACHMDFLKRFDWIVEGMHKNVGIIFGLPSLGGKVLSCRDELKTLVPGHDVEFHNLDHFQTYLRSILRFGTVVSVYPSMNQWR